MLSDVPAAPPSSPIRLTELLTDQTDVVRRSKRLKDKKPYDKE